MKNLILSQACLLVGGIVLSMTAQAKGTTASAPPAFVKAAKSIESQIITLRKGECQTGVAISVAGKMDDSLAGIRQLQKELPVVIQTKAKSSIEQYIAKSDSEMSEMNSHFDFVMNGLNDPDQTPTCKTARTAFQTLHDQSLQLNVQLKTIAGSL